MKYADIEGLTKKDPFKKGFFQVFTKTEKNLMKQRVRILPQSIGEPAALLDFLDYDFYIAFKTDNVGTKSMIADVMAKQIRTGKQKFNSSISKLYSGLGIDLIAYNVNDLICLGAKPLALTDEIDAGDYRKFTDKDIIKGLYQGLKKGCLDSEITIPCGESATMVDVVSKDLLCITGSSIGLIKPKGRAVFGQKLQDGDSIYILTSNGLHSTGMSLARKIVEKLPQGYFTPFGKKTIGEVMLKPTLIYVKPVIEMLQKGIDIHYMSNITGGGFRKFARCKKNFTYVIEKLPRVPKIIKFLQTQESIPDIEAFETWNMGVGYALFAPEKEERKMLEICKKYKQDMLKIGYVKKGEKQVIIKQKNIIY